MKQKIGSIWTEEMPNKAIQIGFTNEFIQQILSECFHVVLTNPTIVTKGKSMFTIETNDGLETIKSPVTGTVQLFNDRARDFPDRMREDDVVLLVFPKSVVVPQPKIKTSEHQMYEDFLQEIRQQPAAPPPAAPAPRMMRRNPQRNR